VLTLTTGPGPICSQEALKSKLGTLSREAQNKLEEDTAKKEAKAEAKADAARKKKLVRSPSQVDFHLIQLIICRPLKYASFPGHLLLF
jgi:hypothetical protein